MAEAAHSGDTGAGDEPFDWIPGTNLYVKNLDDSMDDEWLKKTFGRFGEITSAKVMRQDGGLSKGFGFVCFSTTKEAAAAKDCLNGQMFGAKPLYVSLAQKKEERRAYLEEQYKKPYFERHGASLSETWGVNGKLGQNSTPPRTNTSPLQVNNTSSVNVMAVKMKPKSLPTPLPIVQGPPVTAMSLPAQPIGGVIMNAVGQPININYAPRASYIFAPASSVPPQVVQYNPMAPRPWPTYAPPQAASQPFVGMRPALMPMPQAPPTATQVILNGKIPARPPQNPVPGPQVQYRQTSAGMVQQVVSYHQGMAQTAPVHIRTVPYNQAQSHSLWANGMG